MSRTPTRAAPPRVLTPGFMLLLAAALAALVVLVGLGNWQVRRLHWKEDLLATIDTRRAAEPRELDALLAEATDDPLFRFDYRPVRASGTLEPAEALVYATDRGTVGWQVLQPLRLGDGRALIVNRGFVPDAIIEDRSWRGAPTGPVTVEGLARDPLVAKPNRFVPDNTADEFYWKDFAAIRAALELEPGSTVPLVLDAGPTPPGTLPVGGQTIIDLPNNHFGYAVTWYGIAVALIGVVAALVAGRVRRARAG